MIKQRGQSRKHNFSKGDLGSTPIRGGVGWGYFGARGGGKALKDNFSFIN